MIQGDDKEVLILLLERSITKIFADGREAEYFSALYTRCFPHANNFIVGRTPNATIAMAL